MKKCPRSLYFTLLTLHFLNGSSCLDCYPATIDKDISLIFCSIFSLQNVKDFSYFLNITSCIDCYPTTIGKGFIFFKCIQLYGLLPHHYWQRLLLIFCSKCKQMCYQISYLPTIGKNFLIRLFVLSLAMRQKCPLECGFLKPGSSLSPGVYKK